MMVSRVLVAVSLMTVSRSQNLTTQTVDCDLSTSSVATAFSLPCGAAVQVADPDTDGNDYWSAITTTFNLIGTADLSYCVSPRVTFTFLNNDFSGADEYLKVYEGASTSDPEMATCNTDEDAVCDTRTCFTDMSLTGDYSTSSSIDITVYASAAVDGVNFDGTDVCLGGNQVDGTLTLTCDRYVPFPIAGLRDAALIQSRPTSSFSASSDICVTVAGRTANCADAAAMNREGFAAGCGGDCPEIVKYLTVDLGSTRSIGAISTAGRVVVNQRVTSFTFSYATSEDPTNFKDYGEVFAGNSDLTTEVVHILPRSVEARWVRFTVQTFYGWASMRVEAFEGTSEVQIDVSDGADIHDPFVNFESYPADNVIISDEMFISFDLRLDFDDANDDEIWTLGNTLFAWDVIEQKFRFVFLGQDMGHLDKVFTAEHTGLMYRHAIYITQTQFIWALDGVTMVDQAKDPHDVSLGNRLFMGNRGWIYIKNFAITPGASSSPTLAPTLAPTVNAGSVYIWEEYGYTLWRKVASCTASKDDSVFTWYDRSDFDIKPVAIKFAPRDDLYDADFVVQTSWEQYAFDGNWPSTEQEDWFDEWLQEYAEVSCRELDGRSGWFELGTEDYWTGSTAAVARTSSADYCYWHGRDMDDWHDWSESNIYISDEGIAISPAKKQCLWEIGNSAVIPRDIDIYVGWRAGDSLAALGDATITVMACEGWTHNPGIGKLKMQFKGNEGASKWFYVNDATTLPVDGGSQSYTFSLEYGAFAEDLYSVMLAIDDDTGYCIRWINVKYSQEILHAFGSNHFGTGLVISSSCAYDMVAISGDSGSDSVYVQCVSDFLEFFVYKARGVNRMQMHSCIGADSGMSSASMNGNLYAVLMGKVDGYNSYEVGPLTYLYTAQDWSFNAERVFELNSDVYMDDVIVASIVNANDTDILCVDSVLIDDTHSARHISSTHIGGTSSSRVSHSIFMYPVCKTEVLSMSIDYDSSLASAIAGEATITGLQCTNQNRIVSSECSIAQSYELSKVTSFAISNENAATSEYSWGSATSLSFTTGSSAEAWSSGSTTNEFSFGFEQSASVGAEVFGVSAEVSVGANQQWTNSGTSEGGSSSGSSAEQTSSNEQSQGSSTANTVIAGTESAYETAQTTSIECSASMEVPPSHSVQYSLIFNAYNTTIRAYTDLKLTLCSAFILPNADESQHVIYIDNVPGQLYHKETTACNVQFEAAQYLRNDMTCIDEKKLALAAGSAYIPLCQDVEPELYDGCQCSSGDTWTCWCVDQTGNLLESAGDQKPSYVDDDVSWQQFCVERLACSNSTVEFTQTTTPAPVTPPTTATPTTAAPVVAALAVPETVEKKSLPTFDDLENPEKTTNLFDVMTVIIAIVLSMLLVLVLCLWNQVRTLPEKMRWTPVKTYSDSEMDAAAP